MDSETRALNFSIQGSLITRMAREAVFYTDPPRIKWAIDLLMGSIVTDELSEGDRLALAIKIIEGDADIVGVYPSDDYGVDVHDEAKHAGKLWKHLEQKYAELQEIKSENLKLKQMLSFVGEDLQDDTKHRINRTWRSDMDDDEDIFPSLDDTTQWLDGLSGGMSSQDEAMVDSYLERMRHKAFGRNSPLAADKAADTVSAQVSEAYAAANPTDADYGWLSPTGEFFPVDFAEHSSWAWEYIRKQTPDPKERDKVIFSAGIESAGDYLQSRGWVLLHNPSMGTAIVTEGPTQTLTKAQREFLYDYYTARGKHAMAEKYFKEEND